MATIKQNKHARPAAVELRDDALDQAVSGGSIDIRGHNT